MAAPSGDRAGKKSTAARAFCGKFLLLCRLLGRFALNFGERQLFFGSLWGLLPSLVLGVLSSVLFSHVLPVGFAVF